MRSFLKLKIALVALIAVAALVVAQPAQAIIVTPDTTTFAPDEPGPVGGKLEVSQSVPLIAPTFTGTLHSAVYSGDLSNDLGGLTFVYWIENTGPNSLSRLTVTNFTGFQTDMSYEPTVEEGVPTKAPTLVDRSAGLGDVIGFSFLGGILGPGKIAPGERTNLLVVQTDAQTWQNTTAFVINGSTASGASYAPNAIVPEPSSIALAGMGIAGALAFAWRRRKA